MEGPSLTVFQVIVAFGVDVHDCQDLDSIYRSLQQHTLPEYLVASVSRFLLPLNLSLGAELPDLHHLGLLWLGLSRLILDLYVTNIPIDPAVRRILQGRILETRISLLQEEIDAIEEGEIIRKGIADSNRLQSARDRLITLEAERVQLGPSIDRDTDAARLAVMYHEIHGFLEDAFATDKIDQIGVALVSDPEIGFKMEENAQLAFAAFVQRLEVNYEEMADLTAPVILAVLCARFGLHMIKRHSELTQTHSTLLPALLSFPSSSRDRRVEASTGTMDLSVRVLRASFVANQLDAKSARHTLMSQYIESLRSIYQTWSDIRLREDQEAQEAESLYRVRKTNVEAMSDTEREEEEFAALFPSFEGVGDEGAIQEAADASPKQSFPPSLVLAFHHLLARPHRDISQPPELFLKTVSDTFDPAKYPETLDQISLAFQLGQLSQTHSRKEQSAAYLNFYLSPNEPEVRKAYTLLLRLGRRLDALIDEWPEQMVLQHIRDRVERIFQLHLSSPLAQVLSALEGLLTHTDDWEPFANRENSLSVYRTEIINLSIAWRKLELNSWTRLLDDTLKQHIDADAEWTLRLYGALIQGSLMATDMSSHLEEVLPMLRTYLSTSNMGHYDGRLSLLQVFETLASDLSIADIDQKNAMQSISSLLHNVVANGALYLDRITATLQTQRSEIDKSIKDFIKLASWKDVNVFALKASAQKSHRQLYKSVRKFKEALQQPVAPILVDFNSICVQTSAKTTLEPLAIRFAAVPAPSEEVISARPGANVEIPKHLVDLNTTFKRYSQVLDSTAQNDDEGHISASVEQLSTDIVETSTELAKATPATLTKANTKLVQNLASRKTESLFRPAQGTTIPWLLAERPGKSACTTTVVDLASFQSTTAVSHWTWNAEPLD